MLKVKVMKVQSIINILLKYNQYLNPIDNEIVIDLNLETLKNIDNIQLKQ